MLKKLFKTFQPSIEKRTYVEIVDLTDKSDDVIEDDETSTEEQLNRIDRGGLQHVLVKLIHLWNPWK